MKSVGREAEGSRAHVAGRHENYGPDRKSPAKPNNYTTFFFSNFPSGYGELDMLKIFQRWARVKEVFISRRLNRWGRRFGFVRFFDVGNVGKLERELDQIYVGNTKLYVNIPKYRHHPEERPRKERKEARHLNLVKPINEHLKMTETAENLTKKGKEVRVEKREKISYAEAVRGPARKEWKEIGFNTKPLTLPWMKSSALGILNAGMDYELLEEEG